MTPPAAPPARSPPPAGPRPPGHRPRPVRTQPPQARRGPVGARLPRAAEPQRAVQEGRQPAQRAGPHREHLLPARASPPSTAATCAAGSAGSASTPSASPAWTAARPAPSSPRSSTTSSSCSGSASTAACSAPTQLRALGEIGTDFARDTADVTDRQNIQYHWIRIEDVPAIWAAPRGGRPGHPGGLRRLARAPFLGSPVAGVAADEIIDGTAGAGGDQAPLHRRPGVRQPAAQVQDRAHRPPQPGRGPRGQRRVLRRHRPPRARPRLRPLGRRRPLDQPDAGPEARRLDPPRRGRRRLGGRDLGLPRLRLPPAALAGPAEVPGPGLGRGEVPRGPRGASTSTAPSSTATPPPSPPRSGDHIGVHRAEGRPLLRRRRADRRPGLRHDAHPARRARRGARRRAAPGSTAYQKLVVLGVEAGPGREPGRRAGRDRALGATRRTGGATRWPAPASSSASSRSSRPSSARPT